MVDYAEHEPVESQAEFEALKSRILGFMMSLTKSEQRVLALVFITPIWLRQQALDELDSSTWLFRFNELARSTADLEYPEYIACASSILVKAMSNLSFPDDVGSRLEVISPTAVGVFKFLSSSHDFARLYEANLNIMERKDNGLVRDMRTRAERDEEEAQQEEGVVGEVLRRITEAEAQE